MLVTVENLLIAVLGWVCGAFVNYLADVLPLRRKLVSPFCLHCRQNFTWLNYLLWPRRCSFCNRRRSWRTWVVEITSILAALWLWNRPPAKLGFWLGLILLVYFGMIVLIDMEHRLILHPTSIAGAVLALGLGVWMHGLRSTLVGGLMGFGIMLAIYYFGLLLGRLITRRRGYGEEEALGFGDVNLSGIIGLLLGESVIIYGLVLGIVIGAAGSLVVMLVLLAIRRYRLFTAIPYGPFLVASAIVLLYFKEGFDHFVFRILH